MCKILSFVLMMVVSFLLVEDVVSESVVKIVEEDCFVMVEIFDLIVEYCQDGKFECCMMCFLICGCKVVDECYYVGVFILVIYFYFLFEEVVVSGVVGEVFKVSCLL